MTLRGPRVAFALAGLVVAAGCGTGSGGGRPPASASPAPSSSPPASSACASAQHVMLGRPGVSRAPAAAHFTTDGGALYVSASGFPHGGSFDPKVGKTKVYVGPAAAPPTYDRQSSSVSNVRVAVDVDEGRQTRLDLPAGDWWLLSSWTVDISLDACAASTISHVTPKP